MRIIALIRYGFYLMNNRNKVILFLIITGWIRVLFIVISGIFLYMNINELTPSNSNKQSIDYTQIEYRLLT